MAAKKKRRPSRQRPIHPLVVKAGMASDPVWSRYREGDEIPETTRKWMEDRHEVECPACEEKWWRVTLSTPICHGCWALVTLEGKLWWWRSKKTVKSLSRFLDTYFTEAA